ncbi:hypothetical protein [Yersinia rochesterensis]|uniref:hypothetical protein n=1 Tax=Yersinia rochesterensis TaxID=1604335 RepID=UPI0011A993D0|nr:hypothetical protein [Yersinia rochesterensis]EKN3731993.1 hypothetical protein [Yersinia enterocolitica]
MAETDNAESKAKWPSFYPDDLTIPPEDAVDAEGSFYRLVCRLPPEKECFLTTHEEQPLRHLNCRDDDERKNVYGTSFYSDKKLIERTRETFEEALGDKKIAYGSLSPFMGKMKKTGRKAHYTAWLMLGCEVHTCFEGAE